MRYCNAALRGGDFLLLAQLPEPQPVWAQQYNERMEPSWARAFEPPAACGYESIGVMEILIDLYLEFGEEKYLEPIPRALSWYERSAVAPDIWNRYYELGTNRPIFGDRDGQIHYTLKELSEERKSGYRWRGDFGLVVVKSYYERTMKRGRARMLRNQNDEALSANEKRERMKSMHGPVKRMITNLDQHGRWITKALSKRRDKHGHWTVDARQRRNASHGRLIRKRNDWIPGEWIATKVFIENTEILCEYLNLLNDE